MKSLKEYVALTVKLQEELKYLHPPALDPDKAYSIPWILRSRLVTNLGFKQKISVPASMSIDELYGAFPDANNWLARFAKASSPKTSVKALLKHLGFRHSAHLLTMYFCIFGDPIVQTTSAEFIKQHQEGLRKKLKKYIKDHGVLPHPAVLLRQFKKGHGDK